MIFVLGVSTVVVILVMARRGRARQRPNGDAIVQVSARDDRSHSLGRAPRGWLRGSGGSM